MTRDSRPAPSSTAARPPRRGRRGAPASAVLLLVIATQLAADEVRFAASDADAGDLFGADVAALGDTNGDGFADLVVAAPQDDTRGSLAGAVYVYAGSATGLDLATELEILASDGAAGDAFGVAVAGAGDLDGDGYADLVVGASQADATGTDAGAVYVYRGSATGLDIATELKILASDALAGAEFGDSVRSVGDADGDGDSELVVGAPQADASGTGGGAAYVYPGSAGGADLTAELRLVASDATADDRFGDDVSGAGDLDGDGYADLLVGAPGDDDLGTGSGAVYVYLGSATGIDPGTEAKLLASDGADEDGFGAALGAAGDVNADGYDDVVIGASGDDDLGAESGAAYVYLGSVAGLDAASELRLQASDGAAADEFGRFARGVGDLDADGFDDLVLGVYHHDHAGSESGAAYLYYGGSTGVDAASELEITASDASADAWYGYAAVGAGDLDADGRDELAVGSPGVDAGALSGAVYLYDGDPRDTDGDGWSEPEDCDEGDAAISPSATEICDATDVDEDCDGLADDADPSVDPASLTPYFTDEDADGEPGTDAAACDLPLVAYPTRSDCDDTDPTVFDLSQQFADRDGDGFGTFRHPKYQCGVVAGWSTSRSDCHDEDASIHPGAVEIPCNAYDEDCDHVVLEVGVLYQDLDGDGYGDASVSRESCALAEPGWVVDATDCDDANAEANPGATEIGCNGGDENCDGQADEGSENVTVYQDSDADGYGDPEHSEVQCGGPEAGWSLDNTDCDDEDDTINPGELDLCDYIDNDCNDYVDDLAVHMNIYRDEDGDGYGGEETKGHCADELVDAGWTYDDGDCDDGDSLVFPGSGNDDTCDGVDNDCDGTVDGDGWFYNACGGGCSQPAYEGPSSSGCASESSGPSGGGGVCGPGSDGACCGGAAVLMTALVLRRRKAARRRGARAADQ